MEEIGVGIIGSGFVAEIHVEAFRHVPGARIVAVASPTEGKAAEFARKHGIPHAFTDYRQLLELPEVQVVDLDHHGAGHHRQRRDIGAEPQGEQVARTAMALGRGHVVDGVVLDERGGLGVGHLLARCGWPGAGAERPATRPTAFHCGR